MMRPMRTLLALLALAIAGCASVVTAPGPGPEPVPGLEPGPALELPPLPPPAARTENLAIAGLLDGARTDAAAGRLANAAASLERALRIEPRNPRLWHELARVRLKQGDYAQAESTAARSNSWAGNDNALRADNWRLIAQARNARGDSEGAKGALETAERQR
jgi:Tfp pilus assembly protein PilF